MSFELAKRASTGVATVPEWDNVTVWLREFKSAATQDAYRRDLRQFAEFCVANGIDQMNPLPGHLTTWLSTIDGSDATRARKVAAVCSFYRWARFNGITTADPSPLHRPTVHTDDADKLGLDRDQLRAVLEASKGYGPRAHALVTLLTYCGLRISEALNANVASIGEQVGNHTLKVVGKGSRPRTVPLPAPVWHALTTYLDGRTDGPLFTTASGARLDRQSAHATVHAIGKRVGVDLHPHLLRHSAATAALDSGAPLDRVQVLLGHSSPTVTMRYAKARDQLNKSAAFDLARYLSE